MLRMTMGAYNPWPSTESSAELLRPVDLLDSKAFALIWHLLLDDYHYTTGPPSSVLLIITAHN